MFIKTNRPSIKNNQVLSSLFHQMSDCYRYLGPGEHFRAIAYENVSKVLNNMREDIAVYATDVKKLDEIVGIGKSIAAKIIEYLHSGHIKTFDKLRKKVPFGLLELMDVAGLGPATIKIFHEKLHINNRADLIKALGDDRISSLKGFGTKKLQNIRVALKLDKAGKRLSLAAAEKTGKELLDKIKKLPGVLKAELAGSLRRKQETIGDIDIVVLAQPASRKKIVSMLVSLPMIKKTLAKGGTRVSFILRKDNVQVDIRLVHAYEYGAALLYFTGCKEHNIKLRTLAREKGYKINEYGIFDLKTNKRVAGETEREMYAFLKLKYIPPEQRLDKGEIERAAFGKQILHYK